MQSNPTSSKLLRLPSMGIGGRGISAGSTDGKAWAGRFGLRETSLGFAAARELTASRHCQGTCSSDISASSCDPTQLLQHPKSLNSKPDIFAKLRKATSNCWDDKSNPSGEAASLNLHQGSCIILNINHQPPPQAACVQSSWSSITSTPGNSSLVSLCLRERLISSRLPRSYSID